MPTVIDEDAWLATMRNAALPAIALAAQQMGDPSAASAWEESEHSISLSHPSSLGALLSFSRPDAQGEIAGAGHSAMTFDYLPYAVARLRSYAPNPQLDSSIRLAVLHQIRGRMRDAETARLTPGQYSPAWACTVDVLTWTVLSHFLPQEEIAAFVSQPPGDGVAMERHWQPHPAAPDTLGLHRCVLTPDMGALATDGIEFRLGAPGSPLTRVESNYSGQVHIDIDGIGIPETAIANAIGRPLSKLIDDPILLPATKLLTVRSISNETLKGGAFLAIACDGPRIRCAPAPEGATFAWERLRDPAAALERAVRVLDHGALG